MQDHESDNYKAPYLLVGYIGSILNLDLENLASVYERFLADLVLHQRRTRIDQQQNVTRETRAIIILIFSKVASYSRVQIYLIRPRYSLLLEVAKLDFASATT